MGRSRFTRVGTLRKGIEYQDTFALAILVDWLEHSDRYLWVSVEADAAGYLDDVVALRSDGRLVAQQIKFSTHPDDVSDYWSWDDLLSKQKENQESLLQKWAFSLKKPLLTQHPIHEVSVVSNRQPASDIKHVLSLDGFVDFDRILDQDVRQRIVAQLGAEELARDFFSQFRFHLNEPNLDDLEDGLRRRFYRIGGDEAGWRNLEEELRTWVCERDEPNPDGRINLANVKRAALWYQLQSLPQGFEVPSDYVLPSDQFHADVLDRLLAQRQGCLILTGSPGAGKSTYCSYLYRHLQESGIPVIRHHYFLSLKDRTTRERTDYHRAAASLMHDLERDHAEALSDQTSQNPTPNRLGEWLIACGSHWHEQGKALIVIIDGLDHVWRERRSIEQLDRLLACVLPPPDGVIVLLATQPVADSQLPTFLAQTPRDQWCKLPLLKESAVRTWLQFHTDDIGLSANESTHDFILQRLSDAFYRKSQGHPLHLRYSLKALQERSIAVTEESIDNLPECPHEDINAYYRILWQVLPEESREILHLFAACPFPWPQRRDIARCIDPLGTRSAEVYKALRQVEHLLVQDRMGCRPFHSSLPVFICNLPEHQDYAFDHKQRVLNWLHNEAPDYWRWAYEWTLAADLGDDHFLQEGPDRQWAVESIAKYYPRREVENILARSIEAALTAKNLLRAVECGLFKDYFYSLFEFEVERRELLLYPQLILEDDPFLRARLQADLTVDSVNELYLLAEAEFNQGNFEAARACVEESYARFKASPSRERLLPFLRTAAVTPEYQSAWIVDLAVRNRRSGYAVEILAYFSEYLRAHQDISRLRQLLTVEMVLGDEQELTAEALEGRSLSETERSVVLKQAVLLALEKVLDIDALLSDHRNCCNPYMAIYAVLRHKQGVDLGDYAFPDAKYLSDQHYISYEQQHQLTGWFCEAFFCLLANYLSNRSIQNEEWLQSIDSYTWQRRLVQRLAGVAASLSEQLSLGKAVSFGWFYKEIGKLEFPDVQTARQQSIWRYRAAIADAALEIGLDILMLVGANDNRLVISRTDLETAFECDYFYSNAWMNLYFSRRRALLDEHALRWLFHNTINRVSSSVTPFYERADVFGSLACIAALHELRDQARAFAHDAAENIFTHGHHKDLLLNEVLEVIQTCHRAAGNLPIASDQSLLMQLVRLAPAIAHIDDFTDSDETGHLPRLFAEVLAEIRLELLPTYYRWLCESEEYYDALHTLGVFVESADLSSPINRAISSTAVSDQVLEILAERARKGDTYASDVLSTHLDFLGKNALYRLRNHEESSGDPDGSGLTLTEEEMPSVESFPPAHFEDLVSELSNYSLWQRNNYTDEWIKFWANTDQSNIVLEAVEHLLECGIELRNYDLVFKLVCSVRGKKDAYPYLVKSHYSDNGWGHYFVPRDRAVKRWEMVKQHYPDQWFDFIRDTFTYENPSIDRLSVLRLVEYCFFMGQPELSVRVMETLVETAVGFLSPLTFPEPRWLSANLNPEPIDSSIQMLFTQLVWPSALVRERASTAVANLLIDLQHSEIVVEYLLYWLSQQELESLVTIGLLSLFKAKMLNDDFQPPSVEIVASALNKPSLLSWLLLNELDPAYDLDPVHALVHSGAPPRDFVPAPFFDKYANNFLPPIYYDFWIKEVEKKTQIRVALQYAYEWQCILNEIGMEPSAKSLDFWLRRQEGKEYYVSVDTVMSEIYRSSYLRTLAWTYSQGRMSHRDAIFLASQACPIDLELWRLNPGVRPIWWPHVEETNNQVDTTFVALWQQIGLLWKQQWQEAPDCFDHGWMLAEASGAVSGGSVIFDLEIYGLFQKCHGPTTPSLERIVDWCRGMDKDDFNKIDTSCASNLHFAGTLESQSLRERVQVFDDWTLVPAASIVQVNGTVPRWQYWRMFRNIWLPTPFLTDSLISFQYDDEALRAYCENMVIGKWSDWTDALNEKFIDDVPPATGQHLLVSRTTIREFADRTESNYCWVCCLTGYYRKHRYEAYKKFTDYRVFGASAIVRS